jgi:hypothetical protein
MTKRELCLKEHPTTKNGVCKTCGEVFCPSCGGEINKPLLVNHRSTGWGDVECNLCTNVYHDRQEKNGQ